jgi:hypothetical protein
MDKLNSNNTKITNNNNNQNQKGLERLRLIRNQLLSKKEPIIYKSNKNHFNKWRKKCNFDKELLEEIYYPHHRDVRDYIYKIMINNPEFK